MHLKSVQVFSGYESISIEPREARMTDSIEICHEATQDGASAKE